MKVPCTKCDSFLQKNQSVTLARTVSGQRMVFEKVKADVCADCGEVHIHPSSARRIHREIKAATKKQAA